MSIIERHTPLSYGAARWLIAAINPFRNPVDQPAAPMTSDIAPLLRAAELHGVLPFVLRALRDGGGIRDSNAAHAESERDFDAETAIAAARTLQVNQTGMQLMLKHHGTRALHSLHASGLPAAIVKGPTFARRLYAEPALRSFTDIDILIPTAARNDASRIMGSLGFRLHEKSYRAGKEYFEDTWFLEADPRVTIEVHGDLVHNPTLRRTASVTLADVVAAGDGDPADATAVLFVAAAHGAIGHQFDRLQHLVDIALAATGAAGPVDGTRLAAAAHRSGVVTAVFAALIVAARAFGDERCSALAEVLRPNAIDRRAAGLITADIVVSARSGARSGHSWRRKLLRQAIRFGGWTRQAGPRLEAGGTS